MKIEERLRGDSNARRYQVQAQIKLIYFLFDLVKIGIVKKNGSFIIRRDNHYGRRLWLRVFVVVIYILWELLGNWCEIAAIMLLWELWLFIFVNIYCSKHLIKGWYTGR